MRRTWGRLALGLIGSLPGLSLLAACTGPSERTIALKATPEPQLAPQRVSTTTGGTLVLSRDQTILVASLRRAGVVSIFRVNPLAAADELVLSAPVELDMGADSEPWAAVIGSDDDTAYVILRGEHKVVQIRDLHSTPKRTREVDVGAEPVAIAITPSGARLFVANWSEGTVSLLTTADFSERNQLDLNTLLADTGALGEATARPALAHPRALALTDDGDLDDEDEKLYVTEFFSQPRPDLDWSAAEALLDVSRQGVVYELPVSGEVEEGRLGRALSLAPVADTGFLDAEGRTTGCFPNQLGAATVIEQRLWVSAMCASPRGPTGPAVQRPDETEAAFAARRAANFQTLLQPALFAIDTQRGRQVPALTVLLNRELRRRYDADDTPDDATRRMALLPSDLRTRPTHAGKSQEVYVSAFGADALFRVQLDGKGLLEDIGSPKQRYVSLNPAGTPAGRLPIGLAIVERASVALVLNDDTDNLSVVAFENQSVSTTVDAIVKTKRALEAAELPSKRGRKLFATGLGAWSYRGQAWNSCEGCHPDGLSDGVTWSFPRGPRRTLSTATTYPDSDPSQQRLLLWGANLDEVHDVETIARNVNGGAGGVLWQSYLATSPDCRLQYDGKPGSASGEEPCRASRHTSERHNGLNGSLRALVESGVEENHCDPTIAETLCDVSASTAWTDIDAFIRGVSVPSAPLGLAPGEVQAGQALFEAGRCAGCHSGPGFTSSRVFFSPGADANGRYPFEPPSFASELQLGSLRQQRYIAASPLLQQLNPEAASGSAPLRAWAPLTSSGNTSGDGNTSGSAETDAVLACAYGDAPCEALADHVSCALRDVGTFPAQGDTPNTVGLTAQGAPPVFELRDEVRPKLALGQMGYNIPSLLGLASAGSYFHAGNARSLEEVFAPEFYAHTFALGPRTFLSEVPLERAVQVQQLVSYLLSLDGDSLAPQALPVSSEAPEGYDLCATGEH